MHITKIPSRVRKYLYAEIIFKESKIPISQREKNTNLKGQKVSKLLWLDLDSIYVRSKRLRPTFLPSKVSTQKHPM